MPTGAITQYIDVAQLVLYAFWIFFAGLVLYLHRENKREGYPLDDESGGRGRVIVQGFPAIPKPKTYLLRSGRVVTAPNPERDDRRELPARSFAGHFGSPIVPLGDPMLAGVGPGSYAMRPDTPDLTAQDEARIVPLRVSGELGIEPKDIDPRGLQVVGCDGLVGGHVKDLWIDRAEITFRYLEVELAGGIGGTVLLPINFARIKPSHVQVDSITGGHFAAVPKIKSGESITMLEEEKVMAYYGAGTLYATPARSEPLL